MARQKVRAFRVELAICIGAPLVVLAVIALVGYGRLGGLRGEIAQREAILDGIPVIENRLAVAEQVLGLYRLKNGGKDTSGELSQQVSALAAEHGIKVKSVNSEKVADPESPHSLDYRLAIAGEGAYGAGIRLLDSLEDPVQCVKIASLRLRPKTLLPVPSYDAEVQFQYRFLPLKAREGVAGGGDCREQFAKLGNVLDALKGVRGKKTILDMTRLEKRSQAASRVPVVVVPEVPIAFRLNGIAADGQKPLALTDRGVFGVGDSIDGYRVIAVEKDRLIVEGRRGGQVIINLYRNGETP